MLFSILLCSNEYQDYPLIVEINELLCLINDEEVKSVEILGICGA